MDAYPMLFSLSSGDVALRALLALLALVAVFAGGALLGILWPTLCRLDRLLGAAGLAVLAYGLLVQARAYMLGVAFSWVSAFGVGAYSLAIFAICRYGWREIQRQRSD